MVAKRPHMPVSVQRDAALIALGLEPGNVDWHHEPALALRPYRDEGGKRLYTPDANDPRHIIPMARDGHHARYGHDRRAIDKTRRNGEAEELFRRKLLAKAGLDDKLRNVKRHRIPSRGFDKRHRPMRRQP